MIHRSWNFVLLLTAFVLLFVNQGVWSENVDRTEVKEQEGSEDSDHQVSELIEDLGAEYLSKRNEARSKLTEIGTPAVPELMSAARSDDFRKRKGSILALGKIGDPRALPLLVDGYLSDEPNIKQACRTAIIEFGSKSFKYLEQYISNHPQTGKNVKELLNRLVRRQVERVMYGEISGKGGTGYYDGQFNELKSLGHRVIPVLKKIAKKNYDFEKHAPSPPAKVKRYIEKDHLSSMAINAIGRLGSKKDIPFLKSLAPGAPTRTSRSKVLASALHRLGDTELLDQLKEQIGSEYREAVKNKQGVTKRQLFRIYETGSEYSSLLSRTGSNKKAIKVYRKLLNLPQLRIRDREKGLWYYNLSCSYAQIGKKKKAIKALRNAFQKGYRDAGWLKIDGDMDPLRDMEEFQDIVKKMEKNTVKNGVKLFGGDEEKKQNNIQQDEGDEQESDNDGNEQGD